MLLKPTINNKFRSSNKLHIIIKPGTHVKFIDMDLGINTNLPIPLSPGNTGCHTRTSSYRYGSLFSAPT